MTKKSVDFLLFSDKCVEIMYCLATEGFVYWYFRP